jgi:hypothetical protein
MSTSNSYYTLVTSLPHIPYLFDNRQLPCSRIQLDKRLSMLEPLDTEQLLTMEGLLWWEKQRIGSYPEPEVLTRMQGLLEKLELPLLVEISRWRLELRTVLAGLRMRAQGVGVSDLQQRQGLGRGLSRWSQRIIEHWQAPCFNLEFQFPFLPELNRLLDDGASLDAERLLMEQLWNRLVSEQSGHYFDFEAVALYVMRWHLVERWIKHDRQLAITRFDHLVEQVLACEHLIMREQA